MCIRDRPEKLKKSGKMKKRKKWKIMFLSGTLPAVFFCEKNISRKNDVHESKLKKRLQNCPIRSGIKFCIDPIFVGSELIWNRTSYDQNTFYEQKIEKNWKREKWKNWKTPKFPNLPSIYFIGKTLWLRNNEKSENVKN